MSIDIFKSVKVPMELHDISDLLKMLHPEDLKTVLKMANMADVSEQAGSISISRECAENLLVMARNQHTAKNVAELKAALEDKT